MQNIDYKKYIVSKDWLLKKNELISIYLKQNWDIFSINNIKMINENEKKVLTALAEDYDISGWDETGFWSFDPLVKQTGIERRKVRLACRSLTRKGFAKYAKRLVNQDGEMAGAGYAATRQGAALINPCDKCSDLATYDWYEKDGAFTSSNTAGAKHFKLCDKHYQENNLKK